MRSRLDLIKKRDERDVSKPKTVEEVIFDQQAQVDALEAVKTSVDRLYEALNDQEPVDLTVLAKQLETLNEKLDLSDSLKSLQETVAGTKVETVTIKDFNDLLEAVKSNKPLPVKIDLTKFEKAIIQVTQRVQDASLPNQAPDEYTAFRRVVKVGNRLVFDDQPTTAGRRGGGSVASTTTESSTITGIGDGRKVVAAAGTAEALAASTPCMKVIITAETDNTGIVVVGGSTVVAALATRRGTPLYARDSFEMEIDNLADIFLDVTVSGDGVSYTYWT